MFYTSFTAKAFNYLIKTIMYYKTSKVFQLLSGFFAMFSTTYKNSLVGGFLSTQKPKRDTYFQNSKVFTSIDRGISFAVGKLGVAYVFVRNINKDSINNFVYERLSFLKFEYIVAIFLSLMFIIPNAKWNNAYALVGSVGLSFLYIILKASGRNFSIKIRELDISLVFFMLAVAFGVVTSYAMKDSFRILLFFVTAFLFMLMIAGSIKSKKRLLGFLGIIYVSVFLTSLFAIYQGIVGVPIDPVLTDVNLNQGMPGRVFSTFENPNNYAEFLVLFLPLMVAFCLSLKDKLLKIVASVGLLPMFIALMLTYSRSCWVSIAIAAVVFIFLYNKKYIPVFVILALLAIPFLPSSIMNRILTIGNMQDTSNAYRIFIWNGIFNMMRDFWFYGIGIGPATFSKIYPAYADITATVAPHSHNVYLQVWVETGILGAISFMWFAISTARRAAVARLKASRVTKNILIACCATILGIAFVSGVEYIWFYPRVLFAFWAVIGVSIATIKLAISN